MTDYYKQLCETARELGDDGTLDLAHSIVEALSDKDPTRHAIIDECMRMASMLIEKNRGYGNSATDPIRIFSNASAEEQILVRIDDKLSRIKRGKSIGEDTVLDLIGYLILLRVVRREK